MRHMIQSFICGRNVTIVNIPLTLAMPEWDEWVIQGRCGSDFKSYKKQCNEPDEISASRPYR